MAVNNLIKEDDFPELVSRSSNPKIFKWALILFFGIILGSVCFVESRVFLSRSFEAESTAAGLGRVNKNLSLAMAGFSSQSPEKLLNFINGREGYQVIESSIRPIDNSIAFEIGDAWSEVRRDALVGLVHLEKVKSVAKLGESSRLALEQIDANSNRLSTTLNIGGLICVLLSAIAGGVILAKRESKVIIQKVVSVTPLHSSDDEDESSLRKLSTAGKAILESLPKAICRFESDGTIVLWNQAMAALTGVTQEEALGKLISDVIGWSAHGDTGRTAMYRLVAGLGSEEFEWEYKHINGEVLALQGEISAEYDMGDNVVGGVLSVKDITLLRQLRKSLLQSETEKVAILRAMKDTLVQVNHEGKLLGMHDNGDFFESTIGRLYTHDWISDMPDELKAQVMESIKNSLLKPESPEFEFSGVWRGVHRELLIRASSYGRSESLLTFEDISQQRQAETAIKDGESKFEALVEGSADIVLTVNAAGKILYASRAVEEMLGFDSQELIGKSWLDFIADSDRAWLDKAGRKWQDSHQEIGRLVVRHIKKDGTLIETEVAARNLLSVEPVDALVLNIRDVSLRRALERELEEERFRASQVQKQLESVSKNDPVTRLLNFQSFWTYVEAGCNFASDGGTVSCAIFDIKDFSQMNRNYGADFADSYLKAVANELRLRFKTPSMIARLSGGEFGVIMPMVCLDRAIQQSQLVIMPILKLGEREICAEITWGISSAEAESFTPGELVGRAMSEVDAKRKSNHQSSAA